MGVASLATIGRLRPALGPALRKAPLPVTATMVSAFFHCAMALAIVLAARAWSGRPPKTYVVNLVPAIATVSSRESPPSPAALPPRADEAPRPRAAPAELPQRDSASTSREMPARRDTLGLPDRTAPPRAPAALPRPGDKELPTVASSAPPRPDVTPTATAAAQPPRPSAPAPAPPPGQPTGSPLGSGAVTLDVSDFPFAWYMSAVHRKVTARWAGKALEGRQPVALVEIGRDGQIARLAIEKTSGNPYYDQAALRAITEANPFPPLPPEYKEPVLRVHFGFTFVADRG